MPCFTCPRHGSHPCQRVVFILCECERRAVTLLRCDCRGLDFRSRNTPSVHCSVSVYRCGHPLVGFSSEGIKLCQADQVSVPRCTTLHDSAFFPSEVVEQRCLRQPLRSFCIPACKLRNGVGTSEVQRIAVSRRRSGARLYGQRDACRKVRRSGRSQHILEIQHIFSGGQCDDIFRSVCRSNRDKVVSYPSYSERQYSSIEAVAGSSIFFGKIEIRDEQRVGWRHVFLLRCRCGRQTVFLHEEAEVSQ